MKIPEISVGIMSGNEIAFSLTGEYSDERNVIHISGKWKVRLSDDNIILTNGKRNLEVEDGYTLSPDKASESSFTLHNVTIGVNFHWQRDEDQVFRGSLRFLKENGKITAINILTIEDYLASVISSEMSATSSEELLKAHAVVSRSWLLAQINKSRKLAGGGRKFNSSTITDSEIIKWYDREDHKNYDVCADDHCQRYQGITRASTAAVVKAITDTFGEVLTFRGAVCDSRYYKCCGGATELFENAWEPVSHPYLQKIIDNPEPQPGFDHDLRKEESAIKWITGNPEAFCNSSDKTVLSQVLNDYDQETNDFYRWKTRYTQKEISELVLKRTGIDFGLITDLEPLERGTSGRIIRLKIIGTNKTMIIGKELEIRKALSKTHLYSSCFYVEKVEGVERVERVDGVERVEGGRDTEFILHGAGWGHGVGLCQIGAAVMGSKGYKYRDILLHYFKNAKLEKLY
jgi:stage II sporulation protein D